MVFVMGIEIETKNCPKLLIVGYGRHGKDHAAEALSVITHLRYGGSTSWAALPDMSAHLGVHPQIAWERRHLPGNRKIWYDHCNELRSKDPLTLVRRVLACADIVCGIRDKVELQACRESGIFEKIIWVDASLRRPEVDSTVTFHREDCDLVVYNNLDKRAFNFELYRLAQNLTLPMRMENFWEAEIALREAGLCE